MAPQPQGPQQPRQGQQANAPVPVAWPFPVGVEATVNVSDYDQTLTQTTATQRFQDVRVQPDGWLRGIWFDFNMVTSGNTNTVTINENAPWNVIDTVLFQDTGGEQIFGPFNGYDWFVSNKFGAYHPQADPRGDVSYSITTSSATNAGSFHFTLYLPLEITAADALGSVENRSENSTYRVQLTMAASTTVYSQVPSSLGAMEVKTTQDSYSEPVAVANPGGRPIADAPPSTGTIQYWKQEETTTPASTYSYTIVNGISNGYRNIVFINYRTSGLSRANGDTDFPDPFELTLGTMRLRNLNKAMWRTQMGRQFELTATGTDVAFGRENGVYVLPYTYNKANKVGGDYHNYLRTKSGNTLKGRGSFGNADTLYVNTNYVIPQNNDFTTIIGR